VTKFVHTDYLGSARLMTDASGAVTDSWKYDAYGNVKSHTGPSTTKLSFARQWGYQQDSEGLQLLGHRYYEADTGVFLSRDPALDGSNWFGYAKNKPNKLVDPGGQVGWTIEMYVNFVAALVNGDFDTVALMFEITGDVELPIDLVEAIEEIPKPKGMRVNPNTVSKVKGFIKVVREHLGKIAKEPDSRAVRHWKKEIVTAISRIYRAISK